MDREIEFDLIRVIWTMEREREKFVTCQLKNTHIHWEWVASSSYQRVNDWLKDEENCKMRQSKYMATMERGELKWWNASNTGEHLLTTSRTRARGRWGETREKRREEKRNHFYLSSVIDRYTFSISNNIVIMRWHKRWLRSYRVKDKANRHPHKYIHPHAHTYTYAVFTSASFASRVTAGCDLQMHNTEGEWRVKNVLQRTHFERRKKREREKRHFHSYTSWRDAITTVAATWRVTICTANRSQRLRKCYSVFKSVCIILAATREQVQNKTGERLAKVK